MSDNVDSHEKDGCVYLTCVARQCRITQTHIRNDYHITAKKTCNYLEGSWHGNVNNLTCFYLNVMRISLQSSETLAIVNMLRGGVAQSQSSEASLSPLTLQVHK